MCIIDKQDLKRNARFGGLVTCSERTQTIYELLQVQDAQNFFPTTIPSYPQGGLSFSLLMSSLASRELRIVLRRPKGKPLATR
jgi:hypothetical protein